MTSEGKKAIVFAEFHATVAYLDAALKELCPELPVVSLVKMNKPGDYQPLTWKTTATTLATCPMICRARYTGDAPQIYTLLRYKGE